MKYNKKALYESIMRNVAKQVRSTLNESAAASYTVSCLITNGEDIDMTKIVCEGSYFECLDFLFGGQENEDGFKENKAWRYAITTVAKLAGVSKWDVNLDEEERVEENGRLSLYGNAGDYDFRLVFDLEK